MALMLPVTGSRSRRSPRSGAPMPRVISEGLMLEEKSVPAPDQDVITMSVEAARNALKRARIDPSEIGAIYVGSESHPYAVKPSGTVVAEAIGATPEYPLRRPRVRLQGRLGGHVRRLEPGRRRARWIMPWRSAPTPRRARPAMPWSTPPRPGRRPSSSAARTRSPTWSTPTHS